jgi:hypothetical protein
MRGIRRRKGTMFSALKKIRSGHKFQDDREVARRLTTQDLACCRQGVGKLKCNGAPYKYT